MRKATAALALTAATVLVAPAALAQKGSSSSGTVPAASPDAVGVGLNGEKAEPKEKKGDGDEAGAAGTGSAASDVTEKDGQTYYYIGLRYGLTIIPKFMLNIFVSEGATVTSNTIGAEIDIRKDGFSLIPSISYAEYGKDENVLFLQKNADPNVTGNWSYVNSSLKALYLGADLLWSAKISKNVDFEYGAGFGLGIIFGDLVTNWVSTDPNGSLKSSDGRSFSPCQTEGPINSGCNKADHQNSQIAKVGGYTEPSWANGGSKPNIFPRILLHLAGLRVKPIKQMEARVGLGFSLTEGFWLGISGDYGLERPEKKSGAGANGDGPTLRF
jgi:hypothetical protein